MDDILKLNRISNCKLYFFKKIITTNPGMLVANSSDILTGKFRVPRERERERERRESPNVSGMRICKYEHNCQD